MNETKFINCEQYVLARLFKMEQENEVLKAKLAEQEDATRIAEGKFVELKKLVTQGAGVKVASNGTDRYISLPSVWEKYDDHYDQLVALLELEVPEIENIIEEE